MERPRRRIAVAALAVTAIGAMIAVGLGRIWPPEHSLPIPGESEAMLVEVLNATRVDGLARAVTLRLRRAGIDVVDFGTAAESSLDTTQIVVRRGDSTAAYFVRDLLGVGQIVVDVDPDLLLDLSVILGHDAVPPDDLAP